MVEPFQQFLTRLNRGRPCSRRIAASLGKQPHRAIRDVGHALPSRMVTQVAVVPAAGTRRFRACQPILVGLGIGSPPELPPWVRRRAPCPSLSTQLDERACIGVRHRDESNGPSPSPARAGRGSGDPGMRVLVAGITIPSCRSGFRASRTLLGASSLLCNGQDRLATHDMPLHCPEQLVDALLPGQFRRQDPLTEFRVHVQQEGYAGGPPASRPQPVDILRGVAGESACCRGCRCARATTFQRSRSSVMVTRPAAHRLVVSSNHVKARGDRPSLAIAVVVAQIHLHRDLPPAQVPRTCSRCRGFRSAGRGRPRSESRTPS